MPTQTYTALANITLGSSASSVSFSSIPASFRDLVLISNIQATSGNEARVRFNGNTSAIYSWTQMGGPTVANATTYTGHPFNPNSLISSSNRDLAILNVLDYSATDKQKLMLTRYNPSNNADIVNAMSGRWDSNTAVTSLTVVAMTNAFASGSTFNLFGIAS